MFARVATFEGDREQVQRLAEGIRSQAGSGPPEGVPAKELFLLTGRDSGKALAIVLFETEDDLRQGDETMNSMSPPDDAGVRRASVEMFEVAVHLTA